MQALLGYTSERRWLRYAGARLLGMFPKLPRQSGYNKRLRKLAATMSWLIATLGGETSVATDDVWVIDSTPVECARSRETVKRSDLAGWAEYGYCASHSRFFWGLRLHLVCTLHGLPVGWALTGAKADERSVLPTSSPTPRPWPPGAHRPDLDRGQELLRRRVRGRRRRHRHRAAAPRPQGRAATPGRTVLQAPATNHRVRQRHPQRPARPRSPRRPHHRGRMRPSGPTHPRHDRRDLAQRPHRRQHPPLPDRLRPLTPWNHSSRRRPRWCHRDCCGPPINAADQRARGLGRRSAEARSTHRGARACLLMRRAR